MRERSIAALAILLMSGVFGSCEFGPLGDGTGVLIPDYDEPTITVGEVALTENPSVLTLAAYYCPRFADDLITRGLCELNPEPTPVSSELIFKFVVPLTIDNPNSFPLPAVELLTALEVFPGETNRELGAVCVAFCDENDTDCLDPVEGACTSDEPEIRTAEDFVEAAADFLSIFVTTVATGGVPPELKVKMIEPHSSATIVVAFSISPDALLEVLWIAFSEHQDDVFDAKDFSVHIPYAVRGAIWFVIENFGKIGVNFGPVEGEWEV